MQTIVFIALLILIVQTLAFRSLPSVQSFSRSKSLLSQRTQSLSTSIPRSKTHLKAAEGLSADALNALGSIPDVSDSAADSMVDVSASLGSIMLKLTASPFIVVVPILAGSLVAFGIGFFIFWYGRGAE